MDFNITSYVWYNILTNFDFQGARIKVKILVATFRKKKSFAAALEPTFINGF